MDNKNTPPFRLKSYKIEELRLNNKFEGEEFGNVSFDVHGTLDVRKKILTVNLEFLDVSDDKKERIFLELSGEFEFKDTISIEMIPDYFWANSLGILYPYLRSFVSLVTMNSSENTVILPLLNLSSLGPILKGKINIIED